MTITQTVLATANLLARSSGKIDASAIASIKSESVAVTPSDYYDSSVIENTSSETWNEYEIQTVLGSNYAIENLSSCQSLTGNTVAPVGDGGFGRIRVTNGVVSKIIKCDTEKRGGQTYREFLEYLEGSISRYLYDEVAPLFDSTPDVDYYSAYNHATSTYTRNEACWASSLDFSGVSVASNKGSGWTRQRGGTLITARHILIARHFSYGIGTQVRFSNAAGTVETRTVIGSSIADQAGDLLVCTLNAAVTIANPFKIAGEWLIQDLQLSPESSASWYSGGIVIHTDQNARVYAARLGLSQSKCNSQTLPVTVNGEAFPNFIFNATCKHDESDVIPSLYSGMKNTPVDGDSGQPVFIVIDGLPVLAWAWKTPVSGPPVYQSNGAVLNALIASADANASVSTGLTVTVAPDPTL